MKKIISLVIFALCLCQFGLTQQINRNVGFERVRDSIFIVENGRRYIADRSVVTVKLKPGISKIRKDVKELRSNRLGFVDLSVPEGVDIEHYVSTLEKTGDFEVVEYNSLGELGFVSNDTRRSEQWYLNSINAYSAWDISVGNSNIIVAILDSGTDWGHPDLGNGTDGYSNIDATLGWNYNTNNNNVITTNDHGTRVAGIVGAKTHNSRGIAGISGGNHSSGVTIMPMCVANTQGSVFSAIVDDAIIDAVDNGARVINMSFNAASSTALDAAIAYAIQNNVVLVSISHNHGNSTVTYPASHPDVIAVGAIDQSNRRASFSNYGTNLDVVAPGVNILSTTLNNDYNSQDGTSFAAPQVAGIAALILSVRPDLRQDQVRHAIESTCTKLSAYSFSNNSAHPNGPWNNQVGHGLVNAYAAVNSVAPKISGPDIVCPGSSATFTIQNWQNDQTIEWTPGPYLTKTGESNDQATFTANGNGAGWIDATVDDILLARYNLHVGAPIITSVDGPTETKVNDIEMYTCVTSSGSTVTWSVSPNNNFSFWSVYERTAQIYFHTSRLYQVNAQASNTCGSVTSSKNANVRPCPTCGVVIMSIYPNPASNILNIEINPQTLAQAKTLEQTTTGAKQLKTDPTYDIRLYDYQGNLLRQQKTKGGTVQFNVANFTNGIYYLHIYDGINEKPEMRQIVVEH